MVKSKEQKELITLNNEVGAAKDELPALIIEAGNNARFAWEEFLFGSISNANTRRAYGKAVRDLLDEADKNGLTLQQISPKFIRAHMERMKCAITTRKLRLSAIRHFFDLAVTRHAVPLNPALSVRGERFQQVEGKTPEISVSQSRKLLASVDDATIVGLRDKAILATLIFTAARIGAVAGLTAKDFVSNGEQCLFRFREKGGKAREIPVRHDLAILLKRYLEMAAIPKNSSSPLFLSSKGHSGMLSSNAMCADDIRRMLKRRLHKSGLPELFSPHSFRVCTLTDLLTQDVPREDVQYLAGHADPRTTGLYDRRKKKVTRNIVERISVKL